MEQNNDTEKKLPKWKLWVKRFGIGGIIFFTVKGIQNQCSFQRRKDRVVGFI